MSKTLDRLTLLETFIRIAERGSISAAASDLGLSQPSASRQLAELETRFGVQLIRRTTHSMALTAAGQALLRDAREIVSAWNSIEERHGLADGVVKGPLRVVAPVALGQLYLAETALRFQSDNPLVSLDWQLEDGVIRVAEVGCDCWIKIGPIPDDTLIVRNLGSVERLVVASPNCIGTRSLKTPSDVEKLPFIALGPFEGGRIGLSNAIGKKVELTPKVAVTTNNIFSVHRALLMDTGAAVMPRWFVEEDLESGRLVDVLPKWRAAQLNINAAFLPVRHQPKRLEAFLEAVSREVPKIPGVISAESK
ncbi:LysR family transcriptional regulator [uncultured Roseobacter sp.]|uniref:LysR family transcriptional regulator n=1 Tax=uncultured Roseobacter sp. TaxID=114847 RepID=UPI0026269654|nr:LysR family transcriptional regulator [uncultured Roseobacter sp.]